MRSYEAARSLFSFLGFIAWSVVVFGVLVALVSAAGGSRFGGAGAGLLAMVPGVAIGIAGFILVAFVQMGRATVDTAEYTQQMLKIARDQLDVSKQGLNQGKVLEQGFAALKSAPEEDGQGLTGKDGILHDTISAVRPAASFADATSDASPTKASNSQSKLKLAPASKSVETIEYSGKEIHIEYGKALYNGISFDTLGKAKDYIDNFASKKLPGAHRP